MKKLNVAVLHRFRNGEFLQFMTTVLDLYKEADAKSLQMEGRVDELDRALSKMRDVFMDSKGESINAELRPLDNERIMAVKGLKKFLQSESYRTDLVKKKQAMQLLKSYGQYCDGIDRLSYQHKTAIITKLMEEWTEDPENSAAISSLGGSTWIDDVKTKNDQFYIEYFSKAKTSTTSLLTTKLRGEIKTAYNELVTDTMSFARVVIDKQVYFTLIDKLNGVIDVNNEPILNRMSRRKKEVVGPSPPPKETNVFELADF
ncbi:MAG: DUF6261 family protein [Saprospiraceae bacterium]